MSEDDRRMEDIGTPRTLGDWLCCLFSLTRMAMVNLPCIAWFYFDLLVITRIRCFLGFHHFTGHSYSSPETDDPHHYQICGACYREIDCACDINQTYFAQGMGIKVISAHHEENPFKRAGVEPEIKISATTHDRDA